MTTEITELQVNMKDWQGTKPTWCPGCGDFGVLSATKKGLLRVQCLPKDTVVVSGIGCSSNFPHFIGGYGIHSLHGRTVAVAEGVKIANPDLHVVAAGGDGDGMAIGIGGFLHGARRNVDITYIIMDNQVYGLTVNQASPTSGIGRKTRSTPYGNVEAPFNPVALAIAAGATFVARTFSKEGKQFEEILQKAMEHKGFAFIDALSPCVTFNKVNTYDFWKERVYDINKNGHDTGDYMAAYTKALEFGDKVPIGIFYQTDRPTYDEQDPTIQNFGSVVKRGAHHVEKDVRITIENDHR